MAQVGNRVLICMDSNGLENALLHTSFNPNYGIVEAVKQEPDRKEPALIVRGDDGIIYEGARSCFYTQKEFDKAITQLKNKQQQAIQTAEARIAKLNRKRFTIGINFTKEKEVVKPDGRNWEAWEPPKPKEKVKTKGRDELNR